MVEDRPVRRVERIRELRHVSALQPVQLDWRFDLIRLPDVAHIRRPAVRGLRDRGGFQLQPLPALVLQLGDRT